MVLSALEPALGVKIKRVTREMDAYVITAPKPLTGSLKPATTDRGGAKLGGGVLRATAMDIGLLFYGIEDILKIPVIDETRMQGKFDWNLVYDEQNPQSVIEAIRKEFGLELTLAKRPVEIIVVEK
jgi:uncharacterized protein (TIGR03435 family)